MRVGGNTEYRAPKPTSPMRPSGQSEYQHSRMPRVPDAGALPLERLSDEVNVLDSRLGVQPLLRTSQESFVRDMLTTQRTVRLRSAASADRHPPIGFRGMMLVESSAQERCFR